jgi:hypothetical protein
VFEEDSGEGAVYRADDADIPLSRRPRERFRLDRDGSARLFAAGPDDRLVEQTATWVEEAGAVVIRAAGGGPVLRIVQRSPERLVVQTTPGRRRR